MSSAVELKIFAIAAAITKYKSESMYKSKALINSNISHDEFVLINNVLKEYDTTEEIKNLKT